MITHHKEMNKSNEQKNIVAKSIVIINCQVLYLHRILHYILLTASTLRWGVITLENAQRDSSSILDILTQEF